MSSSADEFQSERLVDSAVGRRTYLVTYAQADITKFPTRESFGNMIASHFNAGTSKVKTEYWACCLEKHQDGGSHYHLSLKLNGVKKWHQVKCNINREENIVVHFSSKPSYYIAAYRYITKEDENVYHSEGHPNLENMNSPPTKNCTLAYREKKRLQRANSDTPTSSSSSSSRTRPPLKKRRLTNLEVADFIINNKIQNSTQLFAEANSRKEAGETDLANFVLARSPKALEDLISNTFRLINSAELLQRKSKSRIDLLREISLGECVDGCNKLWFTSAEEVLVNNKIHPILFASAIRELLFKGRGKHRNIIITGPANCGKTFLLKPLENIYKCFLNPAKDKYAWVGSAEAEVILLQDFRWDPETIAWKTLLLLLEGETVKLPAPKNQFSKDIEISTDIPIFATSKEAVMYKGPNNFRDDREDRMMEVRWKIFRLNVEITEDQQKCIQPCGRCFAELVFTGEIV